MIVLLGYLVRMFDHFPAEWLNLNVVVYTLVTQNVSTSGTEFDP